MSESREQIDEESAEYIIAKLRESFREEAGELLAELEAALLELERTPADTELINRIFRALHTLKGSGGACEFNDVASFAHEIETVFDQMRKGRLAATKQIIDLTLTARDRLKSMFDTHYSGESHDANNVSDIIATFKRLQAGVGEHRPRGPAPSAALQEERESLPLKPCPEALQHEGKPVTYRIRFRHGPDSLECSANPIGLLNELRQMGPCTATVRTDTVPHPEEHDTAAFRAWWDIILATTHGINAIYDVFIFMKDDIELSVEVIGEDGGPESEEAACNRAHGVLFEQAPLSSVDGGAAGADASRFSPVFERHVRDASEKGMEPESAASIRVATGKLDGLVDLVGELVTVQARLSQTILSRSDPDLLTIAEEVERLTGDLRDKAMSIRMLPIGTTFRRFRRLVRDLSKELGKDVELTIEGAETEIDKNVIERLNDPLVHLIRNSIDHGIEPPDDREAAGKQRRGMVHLSATHSGMQVLIRIMDDGRGLDAGAIRAKAVERGLIPADAVLPDAEMYKLILVPGFSTAENVTNVSGRGVGLDVVKKAIDALRGTIGFTSRKGMGTTITLGLPLTLAIIEGLLVKISEEHFIIPLSFVNECVELFRKNDETCGSRRIANVRGEIVPYIRLREQFHTGGTPPAVEQIVIVGTDGNKTGFVVDAVIGGRQTVIKNLGRFYRDVEGVSGATILGNGAVALILDAPTLIRIAEQEEVAATVR